MLAADDFEFLVFLLLFCRNKGRDVVAFLFEDAFSQAFLQTGLVAADLPFDGGYTGINSS